MTSAFARTIGDIPTRARRAYRLLEILPGAMVWATLIAAVAISLFWPIGAIAFIVFFDVYWLVRILYIMSFVILAFHRYRQALKHNWRHELEVLPDWDKIWHLIVIPTSTEPKAVLEQTLESLTKIDYRLDRCFVVLATEGRTQDKHRAEYEELAARFAPRFGNFIWTVHPANVPGEVIGKGSNISWAGHKVQEVLDAQGIQYSNVIVSTFDADSIAHPQYFSYLAYTFLKHPDRQHSSYQPIPLFHNNIWETLPWMRVVSYSTTFWLMGDTQRPDRLFTFSSHSMPFQALVDVGFWQTDVVSEDSRIFLQCLIQYDGHYQVTPLYIPISMDAVEAPSWWQGMKNQYKQIRRWAYGVENFPFMVWNFLHDPAMPTSTKIRYTWYQLEGVYSWAVAPMLITLMGWLPYQANRTLLNGSILAHNAPSVLQGLMLSAMIGAIISALLSMVMLPDRPHHVIRWQWVVMGAQWLLLPITMIIFGSIPAIESQTRLMLGKYLGFWVTDKQRR